MYTPSEPSALPPTNSERSKVANLSSRGVWGLCIFAVLILSPAVAALFLDATPTAQPASALGLSVALWAFWLAVWGKPYRACFAAIPFLLTIPVTHYLLFTYHSQLSPQLIGIMLETNTEEAEQYLHGPVLVIVLAYAATLGIGFGALRMMRRDAVQWTPRWRLFAVLGAPTILGALHFAYQPLESAAAGLQHAAGAFRTNPWPRELESTRFTAPFGIFLQIADAIDGHRRIVAVRHLQENFRFDARSLVQSPDRQVHILIIGESARADRWSLNDYAHETSPRLRRESNLVNFSNVVTVAPWTRVSVPVILTRTPVERVLEAQFPERSLVSAFREAGFATYWMSTQAPVGIMDAAFTTYAKEAEHVLFFNPTRGWEETPPDGVMLEPLQKILGSPRDKNQLIVIHTLGSHLAYRYRYPDGFDVFKPSLTKGAAPSLHDTTYVHELSNTYDNSILYTDYFLDAVITAVKASGRPLATVLYVSDHGEDLYDGGCDNWGHGHTTPAGIRVPLFFWYSNAYQQMFPDKVATLKSHSHEPLTTESVFPLMLDSGGIQFPGLDPTRSVMSRAFTPSAKRLVHAIDGTVIDFDHAHRNAQCQLVN